MARKRVKTRLANTRSPEDRLRNDLYYQEHLRDQQNERIAKLLNQLFPPLTPVYVTDCTGRRMRGTVACSTSTSHVGLVPVKSSAGKVHWKSWKDVQRDLSVKQTLRGTVKESREFGKG
jgi:hypothetical protein